MRTLINFLLIKLYYRCYFIIKKKSIKKYKKSIKKYKKVYFMNFFIFKNKIL